MMSVLLLNATYEPLSIVSIRRAVVLLCYHGGLTHVEAAEILELPLGTLKSRLHATLEELRGMLGATYRTSETEAGP